jgi:hypothetical protein
MKAFSCGVMIAAYSTVMLAQTTGAPLKATVCELVKEPVRFSGKIVQVRATVNHAGLLTVPGCPSLPLAIPDGPEFTSHMAGHQYAEIRDRSELNHPEQLNWKTFRVPKPITLVKDGKYSVFSEAVEAYHWDVGDDRSACGKPWSCPKFDVTATFVGRFDYEMPKLRAVRRTSRPDQVWGSTGGFPMGSIHLFVDWQLVLQSVSDVDAKAINRSVYDSKNR